MDDRSSDDFFVGYQPRPRCMCGKRIAAWVLVAVATVVTAIVVAQRDPGEATWNLDEQTSFTGVILTQPYPMLRVAPAGGAPATILLVCEGKIGAEALARPFEGKLVRVKGNLLQRPVRSMLELDETAPITPASDSVQLPAMPAAGEARRVTLIGEIVDPKCFLGAMKPGDGKPHKACATLCIKGGIPPVLMTRNADGELVDYLIVPDSLETILPYIADPVTISGELVESGDLRLLHVSRGAIARR